MATVLSRFKDGKSHQIEGAGRVPPIECSIHANQEDAFESILTISVFAM
jgi:hypothetical protein